MTRNVKIQRVYKCVEERCQFTASNRTDLQKHYKEVHSLKENSKSVFDRKRMGVTDLTNFDKCPKCGVDTFTFTNRNNIIVCLGCGKKRRFM